MYHERKKDVTISVADGPTIVDPRNGVAQTGERHVAVNGCRPERASPGGRRRNRSAILRKDARLWERRRSHGRGRATIPARLVRGDVADCRRDLRIDGWRPAQFGRKGARLRRSARRLFARASFAARKAARRSKPPLSSACVMALRDAIASTMAGLER
jgi:hypothetical protein